MSEIFSYALLPLMLLTGFAVIVMLLSALVQDSRRVAYFSLAGLGLVALASYGAWLHAPASAQFFGGSVTIDRFSYYGYCLFLAAGMVTIVSALQQLEEENTLRGEYFALLLFALSGAFVMVSSLDLMTLFLGLETMSLAVYALVGYRRGDRRGNEAILKYFFLGALAAAIFLYGIALIYGAVGTVNLAALAAQLEGTALKNSPVLMLGSLMLVVALGFKIAAFPFHMWLPDVYEGAPSTVTGFMATAVKVAAFAVLIRFLLALGAPGALHDMLTQCLLGMAVLTMFVGNIFAMAQSSVKRMLAFSGIAHTGYLLVGLTALPDVDAGSSVLVYLAAYVLTGIAAFACLSHLSGRFEKRRAFSDFAGVGFEQPLAATVLALCLFSLIGFPPTVGFFAKYYLFLAAVKAGLTPLVVVAVVNSILSIYYYLRLVVVMFMVRSPEPLKTGTSASPMVRLVYVWAACAIFWGGVGGVSLSPLLPGAAPLMQSARQAMETLGLPAQAALSQAR